MMKIFSLEKKGMLYFSIASILMVAICLVVVYIKSQELMIDNGKQRAETMLLTFEATMQNEYANNSPEDFNRKIQINLDQMKKNIPDIVEFTVYQLGDNPRGVASITPENINKKVDPEDVAAAKKNETVVLVDKADGSMIVDVTAPLHFGGQINYVAGAMFSLNDVMAEIKELLVFAILVGIGSLIIIGFIYWLVYIKHDIGRISSQVRKLMELSHEVSQGNLQVEVNVHSQDEVGKLEENFAKMVTDMKQLIFILSPYNCVK